MHLFCFLDTETSGLWRDDLPWDHASQPHAVQIGARLSDEHRRPLSIVSRLVKPTGWTIEAGAREVHGISDALCYKAGVEDWMAFAELEATVALANHIVGFNMQFDRRVIASGARRAGSSGLWWNRRANDMIDVMELLTPIMALPWFEGRGYKFPSMDEACAFFGIERPAAHDALADAETTERLYWAYRKHMEKTA